MSKPSAIVALLLISALFLTACVPEGVEYEILGYCRADGRIYASFTNEGEGTVDFEGAWGLGELGPGETTIGSILLELDEEGEEKAIRKFGEFCPEPEGDNSVIPMMWLLTRGEPGDWPPCILISETHPSVERQQALCFSDQETWEPLGFYDPTWTADNAPCAGPVYSSSSNFGSWVCDGQMRMYHGARLPLFSEDGGGGKGTLYHVYQEHLKHIDG